MDNKCVEKLLETVAFSNGCICSVELIRWEHTHFHPSGNLFPSQLDIRLTDKLKMVCDLIDVKLLDHIIVGRENEYYSFYENNIIPNSYVWLSRDADKIRLNESREDSKESTLKRLELAKRKSYGERKQKESSKHCPKSL